MEYIDTVEGRVAVNVTLRDDAVYFLLHYGTSSITLKASSQITALLYKRFDAIIHTRHPALSKIERMRVVLNGIQLAHDDEGPRIAIKLPETALAAPDTSGGECNTDHFADKGDARAVALTAGGDLVYAMTETERDRYLCFVSRIHHAMQSAYRDLLMRTLFHNAIGSFLGLLDDDDNAKPPPFADFEPDASDTQTDVEALQCTVCATNAKCIMYEPCAHIVCCARCVRMMRTKSCPVCQKTANRVRKVYVS